MARYIDLEELEKRIKKYVKSEIPKEKAFVEWIRDECIRQGYAMSTADVVPKSEVERLQEALSKAEADVKNYMKVAEYQQSLSIKRYHEIKLLKEDIERLEDINERDVENIRLAKQEVAREIFEEIEKYVTKGITVGGEHLTLFNGKKYAELKKKYPEGKT